MDKRNFSKSYNYLKILILISSLLIVGISIAFPIIFPTEAVDTSSQSLGTVFLRDLSPFLTQGSTAVEHFLFAILYILVSLVCLILFPGRSIIEIFTMLLFFAVPKERKYWGIIFDQNTSKPIPFAVIHVQKEKENGKLETIMQLISDLDGRYRVNLQNIDGVIKLTVKAQGYETFIKEISFNELTKRSSLIADIPMIALEHKDNSSLIPKNLIYKLNLQWSFKLIILTYLLSIAAVILSILELNKVPITFSIAQIIMYGSAVIWNTYVIYKRFAPNVGKVVNLDTGESIEGAMVKVYGLNGEQLISVMSNKDGVVNLNLDKGEYLIKVSKPGFKSLNREDSVEDLVKINITSVGYLSKNIELVPKKSILKPSFDRLTLINPFQ